MTDLFTLPETDAADGGAMPPTKTWQPGAAAGTFSALAGGSPNKVAAPPKKKKVRTKAAALGAEAPVVLLPAPKAVKKLSKRAQAAADKLELTKKREADNAAKRILGTDEPDAVVPKKPWLTVFNGKRARPDEVAETLTDLASMLENGQSEKDSVAELARQYSDYDIGQTYERVWLLFDRGVTLSAAMADQTDQFAPVVRELLGAAKMPADTHRNLRQAAVIIVEADNIKAQIKSSLFKPGLLGFFLLLFAFVAAQWLLPMTAGMFSGIGAEVPAMTQITVAAGAVAKWVLAGFVVLIVLATLFWVTIGRKNDDLVEKADRFALRAPLVGDIMRMSVAARFCDVLAACLSVGMSEIESLETAARACGNRALKRWVDEHVGRQNKGLVSFSAVARTDMLPWNFRNRIETTSGPARRIEILQELATTFHSKAQLRMARFSERIGPISEGVVVVAVVIVVLMVVSPVLTFIPTMMDTMN